MINALADLTVGRLFRLWVEIVLACAVAFWLLDRLPGRALSAGGAPIASGLRGLLSAIYFSAVTATSIGYGDIVPHGAARLVAIAEGIAGLILFGCVVSKFVSRRQDELIAEIHRIAFDDRLGRVRTNLHLVRTEIQEATRMCAGLDEPPPHTLARVESVSMILVGELRVIHELLYRPNQAPDESVLESLLASLASIFRELTVLLACVRAEYRRTPLLASSMTTMTRLAREICGECVPREYAPALKRWMDQIQRMAAEVEQI